MRHQDDPSPKSASNHLDFKPIIEALQTYSRDMLELTRNLQYQLSTCREIFGDGLLEVSTVKCIDLLDQRREAIERTVEDVWLMQAELEKLSIDVDRVN